MKWQVSKLRNELDGRRERAKKSASLLSKIMVPMIILALLQICVFAGLVALNGGFSYIKKYSYNFLTEKTVNRKNSVENMLNQKPSFVYEKAEEINGIVEEILKQENKKAADVQTDKELNKRILSACSERMISLIRQARVNDSYIILNSGDLYDDGDTCFRTGLYFRDTDVQENSISDYKDIFMETGSSEIARELGLAFDFDWSLYLDVTDTESGNNDYFYTPVDTYEDHADLPLYNLGYWSGMSSISASKQGSIKYTLPLVSEDGTVYGVIGIGLLEKTIQENIPNNGFFSEGTCYIIGTDVKNSGQYVPLLHQGAVFGRLVTEDTVLNTEHPVEHNLYDFTGRNNEETIGSIQKLKIYSSGSPYRDQSWALISVADREVILSIYNAFLRVMWIAIIAALVISVVIALLVSKKISMPVVKMVGKLNKSHGGNGIVEFNLSGISEIDELASSIVNLQVDVLENASRVSRIMTVSGSRIGVFLFDPHSKNVFVGESLISLLGFKELPDRDVTISMEEFKKQLQVIDRKNIILSLPFFADGESSKQPLNDSREISYTDTDGNVVWFKFTFTGDSTNVMGLVQDITNTVKEKDLIAKIKDAEYTAKLEEANAALQAAYASAVQASHAKTDFLSRMSHDIRTPMNAIIGMTTIAENYLDDRAKLTDCFQKISSSSHYLLALINEVLDMSKIEAGKFVLSKEDINLSELLDNLIEMIQAPVKEKNHKLNVQIHDIEHVNVISDSLRLQQIFMNIMGNAVKYTPPGGQIDFSVSEKAAGQKKIGCYEFVFSDNGKGMKPEFLKKIFEPFEREEDIRVSKEQGTGLGMTITYNIVKMMDGVIKVESEVGKGTTFTVTLYLPFSEAEPIFQEELNGCRVLVIDDDKEVCIGACAVLKDIGMDGEWVLDGQTAVEKILEAARQGNDFQAVLADWKMPGMDGVETIKAIRKNVREQIPVIIYSAYDWSVIEQEAREAGADAFLSKPLMKTKAENVFKSLLGQSHKQKSNTMKEEDFSGCRVLLVDDNELNREIAAEILGMANLEVEIAENGREAVDKFELSAPGYYDMVFMDIQMPILNGYDATREIRGLPHADAKTVPIVAMTANAFAEDVRNAQEAGMNEHISKPLDVKRLFETLNRWIGQKREK